MGGGLVAEFAPEFEEQKQLAHGLRNVFFQLGTGRSLQERSMTYS